MSVQLIKRDGATVAAAWLPLVKMHCRVDFTDDDVYLKDVIDRAIALIERETGLSVCSSQYVFRPDAASAAQYSDFGQYMGDEASNRCAGGGCTGYKVPDATSGLTNISGFRVLVGGDDVTPLYELVGNITPGAPSQRYLVSSGGTISRQGAAPTSTDTVIYFTTGYETPEDTPAGLRDLVLRIAAMYYEDREANSGSNSFAPDWLRHAFSTLWVPRC